MRTEWKSYQENSQIKYVVFAVFAARIQWAREMDILANSHTLVAELNAYCGSVFFPDRQRVFSPRRTCNILRLKHTDLFIFGFQGGSGRELLTGMSGCKKSRLPERVERQQSELVGQCPGELSMLGY